jgi:hypothetical protein
MKQLHVAFVWHMHQPENMRENLAVFPHRRVGFADAAAYFPLRRGFIKLPSPGDVWAAIGTKSRPGEPRPPLQCRICR